MNLKVKKLRQEAKINSPAHPGDVGYDVFATQEVLIKPGQRFKMPLGIAMEFDDTHYCRVEEKSGLAQRGIITMGNVIDSSYRGEIHATLFNCGKESIHFKLGDKVAQLVFIRADTPKVELVEELSDTTRGADGFGSTGK